jgi:hypothetical protein
MKTIISRQEFQQKVIKETKRKTFGLLPSLAFVKTKLSSEVWVWPVVLSQLSRISYSSRLNPIRAIRVIRG